MATKKPIGPRASSTNTPAATPVTREPVVDPVVAAALGGATTSASDLIADSERDDEPAGTDEVATSVAEVTGAVRDAVGVVGVPVPEEVSFGFDETDLDDAPTDLGGGFEARLPSALARRAEQLDAFQQEVTAGADDGDRLSAIDKGAIADGVVYEDTVYEDGTRKREHYADGQRIGHQVWGSDGYYAEQWADDTQFRIDVDGVSSEWALDHDTDEYTWTEDDGSTTRWTNDDELHTLQPNGDLEIKDLSGFDRIVLHPDGSQTEYKRDGRIIHTPPPAEGTGGGEGEGESSSQQGSQQTEEQQRQEEEARREEEEAKRKQEEERKKQEEQEQQDQDEQGESGEGEGGGAGEGEDEGAEEGSASRPEGEVTAGADELLAAGRAFGFHPGAAGRHGWAGTGDVDPADPATGGETEFVGARVDWRSGLVGPADPDIVGGTGSGTVPDSIHPDGGVIDPSDDASGGPAEMGPEDDPFGGMQPGLEPEEQDDVDESPAFGAIDPSVRLLDDLDIEPAAPGSLFGIDDLDG